MDASAVYFLISELYMATTCLMLFLINMHVIEMTPLWFGIPNFAALGAEVAILFSILSLTKKVEKKWAFFAFCLIALIAFVVELIRPHIAVQIIILILSTCFTVLFVINYYTCKYQIPKLITSNQFMQMFTWFELGMVGYGVARILGFFIAAPMVPRDSPNTIALIVFCVYVVLGTFRYMSYIGLRITWVDPKTNDTNPLNQDLAKAITEKAHLLRGLIASNRVIGISALASSISHQLSQPLTAIALRAESSKRELLKSGGSPQAIASLDEVCNESSKLAGLVQNLRQLFSSRSYEFQPINIQQVSQEILEIIEPNLNAKKIQLIKRYQINPIANGDAIQIQQVLINIFNNAIDAISSSTLEKKEIELTITQDETSAIVLINDSGPGIDQKLMPHIFDLYQTSKQSGLGVGLWLCKTIIERHHGSIKAWNSANGGAVFEIRIPLAKSIAD